MRALVAAAQESDDFLKDLYTERSKALNDSEKNSPHGVILSDFRSHFAQFRGAQHLIKLASPPQKSIKSEGLGPGDPPTSPSTRSAELRDHGTGQRMHSPCSTASRLHRAACFSFSRGPAEHKKMRQLQHVYVANTGTRGHFAVHVLHAARASARVLRTTVRSASSTTVDRRLPSA